MVNVAGKGCRVLGPLACRHRQRVQARARSVPDIPPIASWAVAFGSNEAIIPPTVADLGEFGIKLIAAGHCTGWRCGGRSNAFGNALAPTAVGKQFTF